MPMSHIVTAHDNIIMQLTATQHLSMLAKRISWFLEVGTENLREMEIYTESC